MSFSQIFSMLEVGWGMKDDVVMWWCDDEFLADFRRFFSQIFADFLHAGSWKLDDGMMWWWMNGEMMHCFVILKIIFIKSYDWNKKFNQKIQ